MERINQITITNYRAFYNEQGQEKKYQINLPKGENLLIYGENGSGKSSLFKAMQDFFLSSRSEIIPQQNVFTESEPDLPETSINIRFTNNNQYELNRHNSTAFNDDFFNKVKSSFLTYKDILITYFKDIDDKKNNPNLFDLFVNEILYSLSDSDEITETLGELEELKIQIKTFDKAYKREIRGVKDWDQRNEIFLILKENINTKKRELNTKLKYLFNRLLRIANIYLKKYFNFNFSATLKNNNSLIYTRISENSQSIKFTLYLKIKLYDSEIKQYTYQSFLNEARLSALAMSVYLAALKIESKRLKKQNHKFLFLDDIFIGLDTSNRIPLLKILNNNFKDFQIFITTYDRNWFELAKRWFTNSDLKFKSIELYSCENQNESYTFETPLVIDPSLPYFKKAKLYYEKKDYPAAANYLRKACESEIKRILPQHLQLKEKKDTGEVKQIEELGKLFENFKIYVSLNNLDLKPFSKFELYTKIIYNSLSHDDLIATHYKKEIEDSFIIAKYFRKIKTKEILKANNPVLTVSLWKNGAKKKYLHKYEIKLLENLHYIQQGKSNPIFYNSLCKLTTPVPDVKKVTFNEALKIILTEQGYNYPDDVQTLCNNISISTHKKLNTVMNFS